MVVGRPLTGLRQNREMIVLLQGGVLRATVKKIE